jgi:hypothetical protein
MRRWGTVLVVIALLSAACGGGKSGKAASGAKGTTTSTSTTAAPTSTTSGINSTGATAPASASANANNSAGAGTGGAGGSAGAGGGGAATTATTATAKSGGGTNSNASGASTTTAHAAAAGRYTYNRTGSANSSAFGQQSLDGQVPLQVDPPAGADQHSTTNPGGSNSFEQTLRFLADGAYFTQVKQTTSGFAKEFRPNPPVLAVPNNAANGRSWQWTTTSTDGATTLNGSFTAVRHETLTVGGQAVDCLLLDVTLKTSGDVTSTSTDKFWVSYKYGLVVRQQDTTDGTLGSVTFHSTSDQILQSVTPQ